MNTVLQSLKHTLHKAGQQAPAGIRQSDTLQRLYRGAVLAGESRVGYKQVTLPTGIEREFYLDLGNVSERNLYLQQEHEPDDTRVFLSLVANGDTVFDIGGYIGYYSLLASDIVGGEGAVVAFEAHPENHKKIARSVKRNAIGNIRAENVAMSGTSGTVEFHVSSGAATHSLGKETEGFFLSDYRQTGETVDVPTTSVDAYSAAGDLSPDILKIDVEGAEFDVLRGARNSIESHRPAVLLSVHEQKLAAFGTSVDDLYDLLDSLPVCVAIVTAEGTEPLDSPPERPQYTLVLSEN